MNNFEHSVTFEVRATITINSDIYMNDLSECFSEDDVVDKLTDIAMDDLNTFCNKYDPNCKIVIDQIIDYEHDEESSEEIISNWSDYKSETDYFNEDE